MISQLGRLRDAKTEARAAIAALLPQVQATLDGGGGAIVVSPADFPLGEEVASFIRLATKGLRSKRARKKAIKAGNAILAAVV